MPLPGPAVRVDTSARAQWPDHPFIHAQDSFAKKFGTSSLVAIAVVVKDGNIFTPETLQKIHEITRRLDGVGYDSQNDQREELRSALEEQGRTEEQIVKELDRKFPPYPVNHDQVRSLAHSSTRAIQIEPDGSIYPCCLKTKAPLGSLAEERLVDILDSLKGHPALEAINAGDPEAMGLEMGWSREEYRAASHVSDPKGRPYANVCIGCDKFFEAKLGAELRRIRAERLARRAG